ncbi:SOS response-associated peptidase [Paenibacillus psychroresistens]|uniref:Abasic site processing protein n=1 Tax=Paenibacillus psychroresistens TaxID=1778678 RepID=A0A6B8RJH4_9BACL|nr:SOS response-associated peptidase [Paenibacillus psychroresistens]QGQ95884.1 SOS response-associated peptidase [Paenibacillus psychroresistens]
MCGRYTITVSEDELIARYAAEEPTNRYHTPRFNVAPTNRVPVILNDEGITKIDAFRWGLIPFWAKDTKIGYNLINAKADTVAEKPSFRNAFKQRRCLIPADGFYEWKKNGAEKQPYRILLKDQLIFSMAGLWESWTSPEGEEIKSCTIITTNPNELMIDIHDRMPMILSVEDEHKWLDKSQSVEELKAILQPFPMDRMRAYPVSKDVGSVKNQNAELIEEVN